VEGFIKNEKHCNKVKFHVFSVQLSRPQRAFPANNKSKTLLIRALTTKP
jgi:hypothetical protein